LDRRFPATGPNAPWPCHLYSSWVSRSRPSQLRRCSRICSRSRAPSNSGCGLAGFL
jgi:hypothetical protein